MSPATLDAFLDDLVDRLAERPDALDRLAAKLAERVGTSVPATDEWLDVNGAAKYLACKPQRLYALKSAGRIPFHKDGSRLLFSKAELRAFVESGGAVRP
ncbi:MAG TPA: helix-turn-helix domain-containing protein [Thermoleophilaceae bacterium]|nr:helix-turn-helix domain-containing protein [Thermoleophilaceae bacterium]